MSEGRRLGGSKASDVLIGGEPRVRLLPPVVAQRAREAVVRRLAVLVLVAVIAAVAGGFALAFLQNLSAQAQLIAARTETERLLTEQQQYAKGATMADFVKELQGARTVATFNEVLWNEVYADIVAALPPGVILQELAVDGLVPWAGLAEQPIIPLRGMPMLTVKMTLISPSVLDTATLLRSLEKVEGFGFDAVFTTIDGTGPTTSLVDFHLGADALANRFADGVIIPSDETDEVVPTASPTPTPAPTDEAEEDN